MRIVHLVLGVILFATIAQAADGLAMYPPPDAPVPTRAINTRAFEVELDPLDETAARAQIADLYRAAQPQGPWELAGQCAVKTTQRGPRFLRQESVLQDGVYYYTARAARDGHGPTAPPPQLRAQVRVVVDTEEPLVQLIAPHHESSTLVVGEPFVIRWSAVDDNLSPKPVTIMYSGPQGKPMIPIAQRIDNDGTYQWMVPPVEHEKIYFYVLVFDRAGNRGLAVTEQPVPVINPYAKAGAQPEMTEPGETISPGKDGAPKTAESETPEENNDADLWGDGKSPRVTPLAHGTLTEDHGAYVSWIYAGNLVRQDRLKDALRYLRTAVALDPKFDEAWNDTAVVYKELGLFDKAEKASNNALVIDPENPDYLHARGEIYQFRFHEIGLPRLTKGPKLGLEGATHEVYEDVENAIKYYGKALDIAEKRGTLAERAGTYFRLGEICYYVNFDHVGARMYWRKVMDLHTPTPELDFVVWSQGTPKEAIRKEEYARKTAMRVRLQQWQRWAASYLTQLAQMERDHILPPDTMTSEQKIHRATERWPAAVQTAQVQTPLPPAAAAETSWAPSSAPPAPDPYQMQPVQQSPFAQPGFGSRMEAGDYAAKPARRQIPEYDAMRSSREKRERFPWWPFGKNEEKQRRAYEAREATAGFDHGAGEGFWLYEQIR